jgi:hypothetical protein
MHKLNSLKIYRKIMEDKIKRFPKNRCYEAAKILEYFEGLTVTFGFYTPTGQKESHEKRIFHCWNEHRKKDLEIDISQDQFEEVSKEIVINRIGTSNLERNDYVKILFERIPGIKKYTNGLIKSIEQTLKFSH